MNANTLKYIILALFIALALGAVLLFTGVIPGFGGSNSSKGATIKKAELIVWGTQDNQTVFSTLVKSFQETNPGIKIVYVKKTPEGYEEELIRAFATGTGPDIFGIHNTWLQKYSDLLGPAPQSVFSGDEVKSTMVDVVQRDFLANDSLYAVPLSVDTLALYYNTDLFNSSSIVFPPTTWDDFVKDSHLLTKRRQSGDFTVSGTALGGSANVLNAPDILALIMLQYGIPIIDSNGNVNFAVKQNTSDGLTSPAEAALDFYTSFTRPSSSNYSWAKSSPLSSEDLFAQNKVGMIFGYAGTRENLLQKSPRLRFDIAPVPQVKDSVFNRNYASYWGYGVYKNSPNKQISWEFLKHLISQNVQLYYNSAVGKPSAVRSLIAIQQQDPILKVFANEALSATSVNQVDFVVLQKAFTTMIESQISKNESLRQSLIEATQNINATLKKNIP